MSDLLSDSEFDIIVFAHVNGRHNKILKRVKKSRMVGRPDLFKREIIDRSLYEVSAGYEVLVLEDGSINRLLSRVTDNSVHMLANLDLQQHRELFGGVECMALNALLTLENVQNHIRRTWPLDSEGWPLERRRGRERA